LKEIPHLFGPESDKEQLPEIGADAYSEGISLLVGGVPRVWI
jgi:hypothetical protein